MLQIPLSEVHPKTSHLWGATIGEQLFAETRRRVAGYQVGFGEPKVIGFDFTGIEAVNASYLKASLLPLVAGNPLGDDVFAGVLGLAPDVEDEIMVTLSSRKLVIHYFLPPKLHKARIIGNIDQFLRITLQLLTKTAGGAAPELKKKSDEKIGVTGWNNRLAELYRLRLVYRIKSGRTIHYQPLTREII